jgi:hypothetical protein
LNARNIYDMSLFDRLPLEVSEKIYKLSLKDHIESIPRNVYQFHINKGRKRNHYNYIEYRNYNRYNKEQNRLIAIVKCIDHNRSVKDLQDNLFWVEVSFRLAINNSKLLGELEGQYHGNELAKLESRFRCMFTVG